MPEIKKQIVQTTKTPMIEGDNFATYVNRIFNGLVTKADEKGVLPLLGLIVFFMVLGFFKAIFLVLRLVIAPFALMVYYLLRSVGIIEIATENRPKEVVLLK